MYAKKKNKRFGPEMEASAGNEHEGIRSADGQRRWAGDRYSVHSMDGGEAVARMVRRDVLAT
jgi:hypothetical protein